MTELQLRWGALLAIVLGLGLLAHGLSSWEYHSYTELRDGTLLPGAVALWGSAARVEIGLGVALAAGGFLGAREVRRAAGQYR